MFYSSIGRRSFLMLGSAGLTFPLSSFSQDLYPSKPVKLISPSVPGGAVDIISRIAGNALSNGWPDSVVVENKPGAGTSLGAEFVARSQPDGYTLLLAGVASHAINPVVYKSVKYDPLKDFTPIVRIATVPNVLVVRSDFPVDNLKQLIEYLKNKKNRPMYASNGNGTSTHLSAELLWQMTGLEMEHIPYKGSAPALTDLLGGQIVMLFDNISGAIPFIKQGKLKALAVTSSMRNPQLPDVPTFHESGINNFEVNGWAGICGPKGLPKEVVDIVSKKILSYLGKSEAEKKLMDVGWKNSPMGPIEFTNFIKSESIKFKKIAEAAKLQIS